jgi:sphinganine-1-phosphate aldolase
MYFGKSGYVDATRKVVETTRYLCEEIKKIDGIKIIGCPDVSVIAISESG